MNQDPFAALKQRQREMWASFAPTAMFTTPVAGHLVKFAHVGPGDSVLDVGTGTGVVALTAARAGAQVTALDLTPELLEQARDNARIAQRLDITWTEGDAEQLPYPDASFDVVLSQFGHMFAPRPDVAIAEMHRVLKPDGRIAFATWPPDVVRRDHRVELGAQQVELRRLGRVPLDQLLHRPDGALHEEAVVRAAERRERHDAALEKGRIEACAQAARNHGGVAPLRRR